MKNRNQNRYVKKKKQKKTEKRNRRKKYSKSKIDANFWNAYNFRSDSLWNDAQLPFTNPPKLPVPTENLKMFTTIVVIEWNRDQSFITYNV